MDFRCLNCKKATHRDYNQYHYRRKITDNNKPVKKSLCKMMKVSTLPDGYLCCK